MRSSACDDRHVGFTRSNTLIGFPIFFDTALTRFRSFNDSMRIAPIPSFTANATASNLFAGPPKRSFSGGTPVLSARASSPSDAASAMRPFWFIKYNKVGFGFALIEYASEDIEGMLFRSKYTSRCNTVSE